MTHKTDTTLDYYNQHAAAGYQANQTVCCCHDSLKVTVTKKPTLIYQRADSVQPPIYRLKKCD
ncbi:hypothetical protein [Pseudoalteromonas ulvae]|nr:hypothetical protein [Pseudoalteromonas ulvae]